MEVAWISNTFEQFNGITFYMKRICPLLSEKIKLKVYTGRVKGKYPFETISLPAIPNPVFAEYDLVIPFFKPKADVLHVHTPYGMGLATFTSEIPKVATTHSLPHHMFEFAFKERIPENLLGIGWKYLIWFFNHFDCVVCQTHATERMFRSRGLRAKTEVIPNGINLDEFRDPNPERFRKKYGIGEPFAMFLGRFDFTKRPDWVIEVAKNLPEYKFLLVGFGPLDRSLPRLQNTIFLRSLSAGDKIDAYSAASALIMPSRVETEGIVAQEAMACGTPVITAENEVLKEVVGDAGFACRDVRDMTEKVRSLLEDEKLLLEYRERAREQVKKRDIRLSVEKLINLYRRLAG